MKNVFVMNQGLEVCPMRDSIVRIVNKLDE